MTLVVESLEGGRQPRLRGCGASAAAASHGFAAGAGRVRAEGLELWADRVSVEAFYFAPDWCVRELASSDDLADAPGDQLARGRCAAVRRAAARLDYAVVDDFTRVADWLQERAADGA